MSEYTFIVEKKCPICGQTTRIVKTKAKVPVVSTDEDFCVHYKDFNPYFYKIWFCEKCGFAADEKTFLGSIPARHKQKIREFLSKRKLGIKFVEERKVPEAVASFKLAIFYAELNKLPLAKRAGLYLELAWIYRYSGEKEKEMDTLKIAADTYEKSIMTERYPQNGMSDTMAIYLVGAIAFRMGDIERAGKFISRIIGDANVRNYDIPMYKRAKNLWESIREKMKTEEEK